MEKASGTVAGSIGGLWSGSSNSWILGMSRALPATEPPVMEQTEATEETIPESSEVPESDMETETAQEIVEENSFSARYEALPQDQKQLLEDIRVAVAAEDMVQAAKLLDKNRRFLPRSFTEPLKENVSFMMAVPFQRK